MCIHDSVLNESTVQANDGGFLRDEIATQKKYLKLNSTDVCLTPYRLDTLHKAPQISVLMEWHSSSMDFI